MSHVKTMGLVSSVGILTSARVPPHLLGQTVKVNIQGYAYTLYRNSSLFIGTYPIRDGPFPRSAWCSFSPLQKSHRNHRC